MVYLDTKLQVLHGRHHTIKLDYSILLSNGYLDTLTYYHDGEPLPLIFTNEFAKTYHQQPYMLVLPDFKVKTYGQFVIATTSTGKTFMFATIDDFVNSSLLHNLFLLLTLPVASVMMH